MRPNEANIINEAQRKAARVAGVAFLLTMATVVAVNFAINQRLLATGNPVKMARNILAHERLFRLGIVGNLVYAAGLMVLLSALYVILKPVNRALALLAAAWRLTYAATWVLTALNFLTALRLLSGADYVRTLGLDGTQALARLYLSGFDQYYVGLLFYGLASTACSWLWLTSRYVPRPLAAFGLVGSVWCVACTLLMYVFRDFPTLVNLWWFDTPMALFEMTLGVWLVVKGLREPHKAAASA
jgi:hypothetical protein